MKKKRTPREEIRRARIIFGIIVAVVVIVIAVLISAISGKKKDHSEGLDKKPQTDVVESTPDTIDSASSENSEGFKNTQSGNGESEGTESENNESEDTESGNTELTDTEPENTGSEPEGGQVSIPMWTLASVNFRTEADIHSEIITTIPGGVQVEVIEEGESWMKVRYNDQTGYVNVAYLSREEPQRIGRSICIDPGHQASGDNTKEPNGPNSSTMKARVTSGTKGTYTGVYEYELNLVVALLLRDELENRGYTVYMTRTTHDVNISNMERAQYASNVGADIAVRLHANGSESSSVSGALTLSPSTSNPYISNLAADSQRLGKCILDAYCQATGMKNQGASTSDTMTGINWSSVPVTILEMGYMTNESDDRNMQDVSFQSKMVMGIANGIDAYFGV